LAIVNSKEIVKKTEARIKKKIRDMRIGYY
jgi:hypothetical protein